MVSAIYAVFVSWETISFQITKKLQFTKKIIYENNGRLSAISFSESVCEEIRIKEKRKTRLRAKILLNERKKWFLSFKIWKKLSKKIFVSNFKQERQFIENKHSKSTLLGSNSFKISWIVSKRLAPIGFGGNRFAGFQADTSVEVRKPTCQIKAKPIIN